MPNYYSGADPTQAFSSGLMAGYEFIDRIKARAEQQRQLKLQEERDTERLGMQRDEFAFNKKVGEHNYERGLTVEGRQDSDYAHAKVRQPILETQQDAEAKARLRGENLRGDYAQEQLDEAKRNQALEDQSGGAIASMIERNRTLGSIGQQGVPWDNSYVPQPQGAPPAVQTSAPTSAGAPATGAPPAAAPGEPSIYEPRYDVGKPKPPAPAGPIDLAEAQAAEDKRPGPFARAGKAVYDAAGKVVGAVGAPGAAAIAGTSNVLRESAANQVGKYWSFAADPAQGPGEIKGGDMFGSAVDERLRGASFRELRTHPEAFVEPYVKDRKNVPLEVRKTLDYNMQNGLTKQKAQITEQLAALPSGTRFDPKRKALNRELAEVGGNVEALRKAKLETSVEEAGIPEPSVPVNDSRVADLVQKGEADRQAHGPTILTEAEDRALDRRAEQISTSGRLSRSELKTFSQMVAAGKMNMETLFNLDKYASPVKPEKPTLLNVGNGVLFKMYPDGRESWVIAPGAGGSKKTEAELKAHATMIAQGYTALVEDFNGYANQGLIPDAKKGTGRVWAAKAIESLRSNASQFEHDTGIRVTDGDGNLDLTPITNPDQRQIFTSWIVNTWNGGRKGETAVSMPHEDRLSRNIPEARPTLRHGLVRDGMMYVGDGSPETLDANGRPKPEYLIRVDR